MSYGYLLFKEKPIMCQTCGESFTFNLLPPFAINCAIQLSSKFGLKELKQLINKIVYPNLFKLLQVALLISSASCERSFSAMRRILNTYHDGSEKTIQLINNSY
ncbi:hypothetical protein QTP88_004345 [Uroleucon formosanum]